MDKQTYLNGIDEIMQIYTSAKTINHATLTTSIVKHISNITGRNISSYIENVILRRKLSHMQYTLLVDIYDIVQYRETKDLTDLLKYVEDTTGYKQYNISKLPKRINSSYNTELINLFETLQLQEVIAVVRVLATLHHS